jgi:hypothetical protein
MRPTGGRFPYSTNVHGIAQAGPGCCAGDDDMRITLTVLVMLLLLPWTVQAQVATDFRNETLRDLITASSSEQHNPDWWQAMEDRLVQETAVPYDSVAEETLQALVYFSLNHPGKLDLSDTAPVLMDVYRYSEEEGKKILALRGLHAIGDAETMQKLAIEMGRERPSRRVQRLTRAALAEYQREHETKEANR